MAEHFYPGLPFRIILTKVPPSRFLAKMFIFVLVPRNLIMSGVRPDSILSPFWESSHILYHAHDPVFVYLQMKFVALLICAALMILWLEVDAKGKKVKRLPRVTYTIENFLPNVTSDGWFSHTVLIKFSRGKNFERIMEKAASVNKHFNFSGTRYPPYGILVECINNLCADNAKKFSWYIVERLNSGSQCVPPMGVSSYEPEDGQHIVFSYLTWAFFTPNVTATC